MKKLLSITFLFFALVQSSGVAAQDLLNSANLSAINIDFLSDIEIQKVRSQLASNNITIEEAGPILSAKGMPAAEFEKLKARLGTTKLTTTGGGEPENPISGLSLREQEKIENKKKDHLKNYESIKDPEELEKIIKESEEIKKS